MHSGALIAGIILLIFGIGVFIWTNNQIQEHQTLLGQLGRAFDNDTQEKYNQLQIIQLTAVGFGVVGVGALIYGATKK